MSKELIDFLLGITQALIVALITALVAFFFTKRYFSHLLFAKKIEKYGFKSITTNVPSESEMRNLLCKSDRIRIMYVSGKNFLRYNLSLIKTAALQGKKIEILISDEHTKFITDIEKMEKTYGRRDENSYITDEIIEIKDKIKQLQTEDERYAKNIEIRHYDSEYRLPFILGEYDYEKNDKIYHRTKIFLYITLPPYKSSKSVILNLYADTFDKNESDLDMIEMVQQHFDAIWNKQCSREYWINKQLIAKEKTKIKENRKGTLIECAAQHPLKNGDEPNKEFAARLDVGLELYRKLKNENQLVHIYIPGSIHMHNGVSDKISLSQAGKNYLIAKGVSENDILAEEQNNLYKGKDGVYNSADECFVASKIYENGDYKDLYCICSSNQLTKKALFYIEFGVIAKCISVPVDNMYHDLINELFVDVNTILNDDHDYQDEDKKMAQITRANRKPR